jgi:hypothetical protein
MCLGLADSKLVRLAEQRENSSFYVAWLPGHAFLRFQARQDNRTLQKINVQVRNQPSLAKWKMNEWRVSAP